MPKHGCMLFKYRGLYVSGTLRPGKQNARQRIMTRRSRDRAVRLCKRYLAEIEARKNAQRLQAGMKQKSRSFCKKSGLDKKHLGETKGALTLSFFEEN